MDTDFFRRVVSQMAQIFPQISAERRVRHTIVSEYTAYSTFCGNLRENLRHLRETTLRAKKICGKQPNPEPWLWPEFGMAHSSYKYFKKCSNYIAFSSICNKIRCFTRSILRVSSRKNQSRVFSEVWVSGLDLAITFRNQSSV